MKINIKDIIRPTVTLLIICIAAALALSVSNLVTADKIVENEKKELKVAMQTVLKANDYTRMKIDEADDTDSDTALYKATTNGNIIGYTALCTKTGYGGKVKVMVGIDNTAKVQNIAIVSADDETPGLGQNIKTDDFISRFTGVSNANEVDAWTGATISSTAVKDAVTQAFELYNKYKEV